MKEATRLEVRKALLFAAAVAALALVVCAYRPALGAAFVWDDHVLAEKDSAFRHLSIPRLFMAGFWPPNQLTEAATNSYYRPVVLLSFRMDAALGEDAGGFHLSNLIMHLTTCCLVAVVAVRGGARTAAAILGALVWGLAPRLTESVAWIAGRTDVLAAMFGFAALAMSPALDGVERRSHAPLRGALGAVALFLSLASKEVAIAFVAALLAVHKPELRVAYLRRVAPGIGLPVGLWLVLRAIALDAQDRPLRDLGATGRIGTILEATTRYVEMTFDALHPRTSIGMLGEVDRTRMVLGLVLLPLLAAGAVRALRSVSPGVRIGASIATASLALVLHIVPLTVAGGVTADRFLYVPLAGLTIALTCSASSLAPMRARVLGAAALAVSLLFASALRRRANDYRDETAFWIEAVRGAHRSNVMPLRALAGMASAADETELSCRLFERARDIMQSRPNTAPATVRLTLAGLTGCWIRLGRYDDSRALLEALAAEQPRHGRVQMELGFARLHTLDFDGAAAAFANAKTVDPTLIRVIARGTPNLADVRVAAAKFADPGERAMNPLGYAEYLADLGRLKEAEAAYDAIARDPAATDEDRGEALAFVMEHGKVEHAQTLAAEVPPSITAKLAHLFRPRLLRHERFVPHIPEVEQLCFRPHG